MINQLIPKIKKEISIIKSENELMNLKSKYLGVFELIEFQMEAKLVYKKVEE